MVYFILNRTQNALKIGHATDVARRFSQLKTASPDDLELLGAIVGTLADETRLHRRFKGWRIRREWFRADAALLAEVWALLARSSVSEEGRACEHLLRLLDDYGPDAFSMSGPLGPDIDQAVKDLIRPVHAEGGFLAMRRVYDLVTHHASRLYQGRDLALLGSALEWRFDGVGGWYA